MPEARPLQSLLDTLPQKGRVKWIGLRPARGESMREVDSVQLIPNDGLEGDRFKGRPGSARQVTLIQDEHLDTIASCLNKESVTPALLRRNLVVAGLNLLALKDKTFRVGEALLQYSGLCHPCSKMEHVLGEGGYNAMRGHGGITARVIEGGVVRIGDDVWYKGELAG